MSLNRRAVAVGESRGGGIALLTLATAIWGFGFVATRWTLEDFSPTWSNAIRFALCCPVLVIYLWRKKSFTQGVAHWRGGVIMGVFLFFGMWTQTVGIAHTTVAKAGFYTVLYIVFTPLISVFYLKYRLGSRFWLLVLVALFGMALLSEFEVSQFGFGDAIICLSALFFSLHIVAIALVAKPNSSAIELNMMQSLVIAVLSVVSAMVLEGLPDLSPLVVFSAIGQASAISGFLILSFLSTLLAFSIQVVAQKKIPPHLASFLFLSESIFAAVFAYFFLQETLSLIAFVGALISLLSVALVPLTLPKAES